MKKVTSMTLHQEDVRKQRDILYKAIMQKMEEEAVTFNDLVTFGYVGSSNTARRLQKKNNMNIESLISIAKALNCKITFEELKKGEKE